MHKCCERMYGRMDRETCQLKYYFRCVLDSSDQMKFKSMGDFFSRTSLKMQEILKQTGPSKQLFERINFTLSFKIAIF